MRKKIILILLLTIIFISNGYALNENFEYQNFFENTKEIILIIDSSTGQIVDANKAAANFYGYTRSELIKMNIKEINTLAEKEIEKEIVKASRDNIDSFNFEHKLKDGSIRQVEVFSSPIVEVDGETKLFSVIHDITEKKLAEKEAARQTRITFYILGAFILILLNSVSLINKAKKAEAKTKDKYKNLFEHMQEGFALHEIILDDAGKPVDYRFLEANKAFERITGLKIKDIRGKTVKEVLPNTEDYWIEKYGEVALSEHSLFFPNFSIEMNKHFNVSVYSPSPKKFATIFTDISLEKVIQEKISIDRNLFRTTIDSIGDGVISTDIDGNVNIMNKVAEELTGWERSAAKGMPIQRVFNIVNGSTDQPCTGILDSVIKKGQTIELEKDTFLVKKNNERITIEDSASPIKDENGQIKGAVIVFRDYTEKKEKQDKIEYLSYHDNITGLYNRHFLEEEMKRLDVERNLPITIGMIDVNGLKMVNDVFGHDSGDWLLRKIADVLKEQCRADDIVARFGGDEFVILLPKTNSKDTELIMNRINKALDILEKENFILSVSAGWSTKENINQEMKEVLEEAESRMYQKKITETQKMRHRTIDLILKKYYEDNPKEKAHSEEVGELSSKIGKLMNLNDEKIRDLRLAGLTHDIGKSVTGLKIDKIKRHPEIGYQIIKSADKYSNVAEIILSHHERWDGKGYPRRLSGEEIPLGARIMAVALAWLKTESIEDLQECSGKQLDPEIVKLFLESLTE